MRSLSELLDLPTVSRLLSSLSEPLGVAFALIDPTGHVLTSVNWQPICSDFHRHNPAAEKRCRASDRFATRFLRRRGLITKPAPAIYTCHNGLNCAVLPIMVGDQHLANLFASQFFLAPPDPERFSRQAQRYGYDPEAYSAAMEQVPIHSQVSITRVLTFAEQFVSLLVTLGAQRQELIDKHLDNLREQDRLRRQTRAMMQLNQQRSLQSFSPEASLPVVLEVLADTLLVERTSLWFFDDDRSHVQCHDLYTRSGRHHSTEEPLATADFPSYFTAVASMRVVCIPDAVNNPISRDLARPYLNVRGIGALLDTPIWLGERMAGIMCCEHVGSTRQWSTDEVAFARGVADMVSHMLEAFERRRTQQALAESERRLDTLLSNLPGMAYRCLCNPTRTPLFVSQGAAALTGLSADRFGRRKGLTSLVHPDDRAQLRSDWKVAISGGPYQLEYRICTADGQVRWVWDQGQVLDSGPDGPLAEGFITDITERKNLEQIKEDMLSMVGHEVRTPLTSILGFIELLQEQTLPPPQKREALGLMHREGERLLYMLENLLDLQRLRAGRMPGQRKSLDLRKLLQELLDLFRQEHQTHRFALRCSRPLPPIFGDPEQLFQAYRNLMANAVKFSPQGSFITFGAYRHGDALQTWVRDRGIGIPAPHRDRVFERFYRIPQQGRNIPGSGLGLALVKGIVEGHDGNIHLCGRTGQGTTVLIQLPVLHRLDVD